MFHQRHVPSSLVCAIVIAAGGICGEQAWAQGGARIMVMDDGGGAPVISHFSMPDLQEVREPDFIRRDVPTFTEKLVLSEAQVAAIERQIEIYLEAFEQLKKDLLNLPGAQPMVFQMAGVEGGEGGEQGAAFVMAPTMDGQPLLEMFEGEDGELPEDMEFSIGVQVAIPDGEGGGGEGGGGGNGAWAMAEPGVSVAFESSGAELPEEVRKELEQRAQELAEKIKQQIEEQQAAGGNAGEHQLLHPGATDVEEMQKRHDEMEAAVKKFRKAKSELRQVFVGETQTTLSPQQMEYWPSLERALLRDKSLPKGRLSGERTNLFKVIKGLELSSGELVALNKTMDGYDIDLDAALRHRNDVIEDVMPKIDEGIEKGEYDRVLAAMDRAAAARVALRTVNERFTEAMAELLPANVASAFRQSVLKASYPQVYRQTIAEKTLDAAQKLEGLSSEIKDQLSALKAAYRMERDEVDTKLRRAIDKHQPTEPRRPFEHMKAISEGATPETMNELNHPEDPVAEGMAKRRELDDRYIKSVKGFLTPEQIEQLPKTPVRRQGQPIIIHRTIGE